MNLDLEALEAQLAEYDPSTPRCPQKVAEHRNYAPSHVTTDDPEWDDFTTTHYTPCSRPTGHEGECRSSRRVLGWPGYATLKELISEVRRLRESDLQHQAFWKDLP